jgi:hypothetical protein
MQGYLVIAAKRRVATRWTFKLGHILFGHIYFSATPPQRATLLLTLYTINTTYSKWILERLRTIMLSVILMQVFLKASDRLLRHTEFPDRRSKSASTAANHTR